MQTCPFVCLASLRDGSSRSETKTAQSMPPYQWLRNKLVRCGGPGFDKQVLYALAKHGKSFGSTLQSASPHLDVFCLARLEPVIHYEGILTPLSREAKALHEFYHRPSDSYFLRVAERYNLSAKLPIRYQKYPSHSIVGTGTSPINVDGRQPLIKPSWEYECRDPCDEALEGSPFGWGDPKNILLQFFFGCLAAPGDEVGGARYIY